MAKFALISAVTLFVALTSGAPPKKLNIKIPNACKNKSFCTIRPEGYDAIEDQINKLLTPHMIASRVVDRYGLPPTTEITEDNEDNCPSVKSTQSYYIINPGNSTMDIIVQTKILRQTVEVVNCVYDQLSDKPQDQQCFEKLHLNHFDMRSSCQESVANRSLLVFDPELHRFKEKAYTISVCCACKITHV